MLAMRASTGSDPFVFALCKPPDWLIEDSCSTAASSPAVFSNTSPWESPDTSSTRPDDFNDRVVSSPACASFFSLTDQLPTELRQEDVLSSDKVPAFLEPLVDAARPGVETKEPSTPPRSFRTLSTPPGAPRPACACATLRALQENSITQLKASLEEDNGRAWEPFWDFDLEPPICAAARLGCDEHIFECLLKHGANVHATDKQNRTALKILADVNMSAYLRRNAAAFFGALVVTNDHYEAAVTKLLLDAGAQPFIEEPAANSNVDVLRDNPPPLADDWTAIFQHFYEN